MHGADMAVDEDKGLDTESGLDGLTFDAKKEVVSGTLNCMIAWLTSPANSGPFSAMHESCWLTPTQFVCAHKQISTLGRRLCSPITPSPPLRSY